MLPVFQAPAQFNLPLDASNFKSGGLYDPWMGIITTSEKSGCKWII
jgi:hypothetical protein